jgi:soluble lytic murein transglycosylase-like protein
MYLAQMEQESSCRVGIKASDGGEGVAQFMPNTANDISRLYPQLGTPQPYNTAWAIPALIRFDTYLGQHVKGADDCQRRAAALKAYNAGPGYVQQAQRKSPQPEIWFGVTEYVPTRQSAKNFEYSRLYPRWILLDRQPNYRLTGTYTCGNIKP